MAARVFVATLLLAAAAHAGAAAGAEPPLRLAIKASRVGNKAAGVAVITNTGNKPVTVGVVVVDARFMDAAGVTRDDIRQRLRLDACGGRKLPLPLAPGAKLECAFTSRENSYKGRISLAAGALRPGGDWGDEWLAFGVVANVAPAAPAGGGARPAGR
ncbi:hypothetical protein HT031_000857 [Scenedesmus sp. PABB004]|nr:hypothetical protein HT031_000857 [Scenedesmus sp. PABB004]